jgi:cytochrome P450
MHPQPTRSPSVQALADDTLPDGTFIPAGSMVAYLPHAMGRLEQNWPDPDRFDPTRFLDASQRHSAFKFIAFNAGAPPPVGGGGGGGGGV